MSNKNKQYLPSSMGGLLRFSDESKSKFEISPGMVIFLCVLVIVVLLVLQYVGSTLLQ